MCNEASCGGGRFPQPAPNAHDTAVLAGARCRFFHAPQAVGVLPTVGAARRDYTVRKAGAWPHRYFRRLIRQWRCWWRTGHEWADVAPGLRRCLYCRSEQDVRWR